MAKRTSYKDDVEPYLSRIKAWARDGATDEIIVKKLGISRSAFYKFKSQFVDFADALKKGKEDVDIQVENALLKRALGYEYNETTQELSGFGQMRVTKIVTKQVIPDTTAQIFWLKNRRSDKWKNKIDEPEDDTSFENNRKTVAQLITENQTVTKDD